MQCVEHAWWPRGAADWFSEVECNVIEAETQSLIERSHATWTEAICLLEMQGDYYQMNETNEHESIQRYEEQMQFLHTPQREFLILQATQLLNKIPPDQRSVYDATLSNFVLRERAETPLTMCSTPSECPGRPLKTVEKLWPRPWCPSFERPKEQEDPASIARRVFDAEYRWVTKKLIPHLERALENEDVRRADQKSRFTVPTTQNLKGFVEKLEGIVNSGACIDVKSMPFRLRSLCSDFRQKSAQEEESMFGNAAVVTGDVVVDFFFADPFSKDKSEIENQTLNEENALDAEGKASEIPSSPLCPQQVAAEGKRPSAPSREKKTIVGISSSPHSHRHVREREKVI